MFSYKTQLIFIYGCLIITIIKLGASANEAMLDQNESKFSLYEAVLGKIVEHIQMNLKQNTELKPSDIRVLFFLMSEIKKREEIAAKEEKPSSIIYMRQG